MRPHVPPRIGYGTGSATCTPPPGNRRPVALAVAARVAGRWTTAARPVLSDLRAFSGAFEEEYDATTAHSALPLHSSSPGFP